MKVRSGVPSGPPGTTARPGPVRCTEPGSSQNGADVGPVVAVAVGDPGVDGAVAVGVGEGVSGMPCVAVDVGAAVSVAVWVESADAVTVGSAGQPSRDALTARTSSATLTV